MPTRIKILFVIIISPLPLKRSYWWFYGHIYPNRVSTWKVKLHCAVSRISYKKLLVGFVYYTEGGVLRCSVTEQVSFLLHYS